MLVRKGTYLYMDGSLVSLEDLQSVYISRNKVGIVFQYMNGHKVDVKYDVARTCEKNWNIISESLTDILHSDTFLEIRDAMYIRMDSIQHIEFDEIDCRFAILYKTGECFIYDYDSKVVTYAIFKAIVKQYFGVDEYRAVGSRIRADFWQRVTNEINGMVYGEQVLNKDYWTRLDSAVINATYTASVKKRGRKKKQIPESTEDYE